MPDPAPILTVNGLTVTRRGTPILRGIDWTVQRGEMWTILGANGCGKTSLLNCLAGYLTPASGRISVLGETYGQSDWTTLRRRIGIVSSTVRQQIDDDETPFAIIAGGRYGQINFWGRLTKNDRTRATAIARRVHCTALLERPWAVLSQGERQRVLTGRALMAEPDLLILDEPCAGLDPVARARFLTFLQTLASRKRGPSIVLVTHHLEEIPPACTHVLAIRQGQVAAAGPIHEILTGPLLSKVFAAPVTVTCQDGLWALQFPGRRGPQGVF